MPIREIEYPSQRDREDRLFTLKLTAGATVTFHKRDVEDKEWLPTGDAFTASGTYTVNLGLSRTLVRCTEETSRWGFS